MRVAVVTFDGFNELDSLIAAHIINRVDLPGWRAEITSPSEIVTSTVTTRAQCSDLIHNLGPASTP